MTKNKEKDGHKKENSIKFEGLHCLLHMEKEIIYGMTCYIEVFFLSCRSYLRRWN